MKKTIYALCSASLLILSGNGVFAQLAFTNANAKLTGAAVHSGCPVTIVDWNGDGKDDIIRLDQGTICSVEIQRTNNTYEHRSLGTITGTNGAWGMAVADVDHNGYVDIIAGGSGSSVQILKTNNTGSAATIYNLPSSGFFLQNITCCDANNDGWIDIFCCDDNDVSHLYMNDANWLGTFTESTTQIPLAVNPGISYGGDPADSGNYGSAWIDFDNDGDLDLFVAHCRQSTSSNTDLRRQDRLFVNDGSNNYTEMAAFYGIEATVYNQTWTASFGDIDNDGDMDLMVTNHDVPSQILQNDGTGHYTDITSGTNFNISDITPIESVMEDFDNDGFNDIFVTGSNSRFFHNNGNGTFTKIQNLFDANAMESFAIGDLNHDGFIDIYASYATIYTNPGTDPDVIWMNKGNSNNFLTIELKGTVSNKGAIGARATIYGSWGVQIREVRAGESYGTNNSAMCHFGLGTATAVDSVTIHWPSGLDQTIINPAINQFITVIEGNCVSPEAVVAVNGPLVICPGQTLTLTAPAGYNYLWSDGSTNQSLTVTTTGEYNVMITTPGNSCYAISRTLIPQYNPDQTPVITALGETNICNGSAVALAATPGMQSYMWSNGDTNQNAVITQSGTYSVTVMGACQSWTSTVPVTVDVLTAVAPLAGTFNIPVPGTANIWANGNLVKWYDAPIGGTLLATGNAYTTPFLNTNTTFYASNSDAFGNGIYPVGLPNHTGPSLYSSGGTTNALMYFDVDKTCIIKSAMVITDTYGTRRIELRDASGTVLSFVDVNLTADTTVVTLNFTVNPGLQYRLATNGAVNQAIPGWNQLSPRLQRNSTGVSYPYTIADALTFTGSDQGQQYYYYFYNIQVEKPGLVCESELTPITVNIGPVGINEVDFTKTVSVYPNPSSALFNISFTADNADVQINITDISGRTVCNITEQKVMGEFTKKVDLSGNAKGIYILKITSGDQVYHQKITLE